MYNLVVSVTSQRESGVLKRRRATPVPATVVTQAVMLPLYFISGVFVAASILPAWLVNVASLFPVRHLATALLVAYNPHTRRAGLAGTDLLVIAIWGAAGLFIAIHRFSWLPHGH